jgi:flagellar hook protein FlgE
VTALYDNGETALIDTIQIATFNNPGGLLKVGANLFRETNNSGIPNTGVPGTGGRGTLLAGALEASNVELAQEFTNMIIAQRGFQANARVISTSDEVLQDLVNLKR